MTPNPYHVAALCLCLAAGSALAQRQKSAIPELDDGGRRGEMARRAQEKAVERFLAADENADGQISADELSRHSAYMSENFARVDKNGDGVLDWPEYVGHDRWPKPEPKK